MRVGAIDPGKISGVAIFDKSKIIYHSQGPFDEIWKVLIEYSPDLVILEKATARPKQGVVSTCSFCKTYGFWIGILTGFSIPYILVAPTRWKKVLDSGKRDKIHVVEWVNRRFKLSLKKSQHHEAEAIAMAWWGINNNQYEKVNV